MMHSSTAKYALGAAGNAHKGRLAIASLDRVSISGPEPQTGSSQTWVRFAVCRVFDVWFELDLLETGSRIDGCSMIGVSDCS